MVLSGYHPNSVRWLIRDVKHLQGGKGNDKKFNVRLQALPVAAAPLEPETRHRMLECNGTSNSLVPLGLKSISAAFTRTCHVLGVGDLCFHDLRREGTTWPTEDGATPSQMQMVTLHNTWASLERYVNLRKRLQQLEFDKAIKNIKNGLNLSWSAFLEWYLTAPEMWPCFDCPITVCPYACHSLRSAACPSAVSASPAYSAAHFPKSCQP